MYYVVVDIGCTECGEASNIIGIFTTEEKAMNAKEKYILDNRLEGNEDHEILIYRISELNRIYNNSYEHLL
ncbi:DUF7336 domain-containing protein [Ferdinandcohnia quinoae]|uniref:DUF7336 domain-containing protein n=1 Tax=Fredinandcohnia quinoae TaxID=2918902 RepID=A0AAW5DVM2_9BACI|nr:hypothetical protein [Fredinandcohnia sp. SECRCQ15]MCH1624690.1 hypothetical protein [Fredinandcohnia sp. SECRCQ15]